MKNIMSSAFDVVRKNMREKNSQALKIFYTKFDMNQNQKELHKKEIEKDQLIQAIRVEVENVDSNYQICRYVFKFLQLLCEGHNQKLQNLLRQQEISKNISSHKSINFIATSATLWGSYIKFVNPKCVELGEMILDFLIEAIQGPCDQNQTELYHNKMIDFSKDFMNDFSSKRDYESRGFEKDECTDLDNLITQNIKMLNSLLEANQEREIYENMGINIDFNYLINKLSTIFLNIFEDFNLKTNFKLYTVESFDKFINRKDFESKFGEAFDIFFFIHTIDDFTGMYKKHIKELNDHRLLVYEFFNYHSAHIEIVFMESIHKVYFMIHPACRYLDINEKKSFIDNVKRDTPNEKITDFMTKAPKMFDRMDHMSNLRSK